MGTLTSWPQPLTEKPSTLYSLNVDQQPVPVWTARVREEIHKPEAAGYTHMFNGRTDWCAFARFDFAGQVDVEIQLTRPVAQVDVRPRRRQVEPELDGQTIRFRIDQPGSYTIILDDCDRDALHLFTHAPETDRPDPNDEDVLYFGPGEHWLEHVDVQSGQTIYIDGGAIIRAVMPAGIQGRQGGVLNLFHYPPPVFHIHDVENVRITGRGILDGALLPHAARNLLRISDASHVQIDGILLRNSPNWHLPIANSEEIIITGMNGLSGRLNSDGINCVSSHSVQVRDCFIRGHDDSFVVKTTNPGRESHSILYENCVAWNDWGYAFGVSYETRADIHDVVFRNCDAIFARHWAIGVHVSDSGTVHDLRFDGIDVDYPECTAAESMNRACIKIDNQQDVWGKDDQTGRVRNIELHNINLAGRDIPTGVIRGNDAEHPIDGVHFSNLTINDHACRDPGSAGIHVGEHVNNLTFRQ